MENIVNLTHVAEVLEQQGYKVVSKDDAVYTSVGGSSNPFVVVLTVNSGKELVITCQVAKMGDFQEEKLPEMMFALLDINTQIRPYAFGVLSHSDDPEAYDNAGEFPVVLTDSLPIGDLSPQELIKSMECLLVALETSAEALKIGLG